MKKISFLVVIAMMMLLNGCMGIKFLTVETEEPAQLRLPSNVHSVLIVNNVVQQPDDIGHQTFKNGSTVPNKQRASSDSVAIYYTEALSQFLGEEKSFSSVQYLTRPLRQDNEFEQESLIEPEQMNKLRKLSGKGGADAIISLDKLMMETTKLERFEQQGYMYSTLVAKLESTIRVYMPTMEGKIPLIQYQDSLVWEGFEIPDNKAIAEYTLPTREEAMKELAVHAAEKMTNIFAPHWEKQNRWYYTLSNSLMKEGEVFAEAMKWQKAAEKWEAYYNKENNTLKQAKAASNIALAYEMLGDLEASYKWISTSNSLFEKVTNKNSLERKRALFYQLEIERRKSKDNRIDMQ